MRRLAPWFLALTCLILAPPSLAGPPRDDDDRKKSRAQAIDIDYLEFEFDGGSLDGSMAPAPAPTMGATVGGAQDIAYFRDAIAAGVVPEPRTLTPEGLFSEHDLPLGTASGCTQTFCVDSEAIAVSLVGQAEVEYLAQLGLSSGLDPRTFRRAPLNLVAVVDRSGSMRGDPIDLVRQSLREVVAQLGPDDRLSIVSYDTRAQVMLDGATVDQRDAIDRAIDALIAQGSTAMEDGLRLGFELADRSAPKFAGTTRVLLFTDERPNTGATDAESFIGMARRASNRGVGLTTIGVASHFGAELAEALSSVRGGNLFYFPDVHAMREKFAAEFETMVTELAYDLNLVLEPAPGMKIVGIYGIPGSALAWRGEALVLDIETIFLSRRKGGIYVGLRHGHDPALEPMPLAPGDVLGQASLAYEDAADGRIRQAVTGFALVDRRAAGLGLTRGELLVDQATTLRRAALLHHERDDHEGAYQLVRALHGTMQRSTDAALTPELELVAQLEHTLALATGHPHDSIPIMDPITGLPPRP